MEHRISIDDHIWEIAKIEAEKRKISTNEIVKQALETFLAIETKKLSINSEEC
jgi:predicted HicB family RNase H-like nuclease